MKIKLLGKNLDTIRPILTDLGFEECEKDFELVITYGGDGALLGAERSYPQLPKFPLRDADTALPCPLHDAAERLKSFLSGGEETSFLDKVAARCHGKEFVALNDIFIHNFDRGSALRYRVRIDGELYAREIVGATAKNTPIGRNPLLIERHKKRGLSSPLFFMFFFRDDFRSIHFMPVTKNIYEK